MKPLNGNNMATLIPLWAQAIPPYAYDSALSHCNIFVYDGICGYDDTRNTCGITSSTWVTTTFRGEAGFKDNGGIFEDPAGGHERELPESGMPDYGYRYYNPELGRWVNRDPLGEFRRKRSLLITEENIITEKREVRLTETQIQEVISTMLWEYGNKHEIVAIQGKVEEIRQQIRNNFDNAAIRAKLDEQLDKISIQTRDLPASFRQDVYKQYLQWIGELSTDSPTLYPFIGNNPLNGVDPNGDAALWVTVTGCTLIVIFVWEAVTRHRSGRSGSLPAPGDPGYPSPAVPPQTGGPRW